ncbi:hypothetical protein [Bacillus sp. AFS023182]|nr:hypothetical protein [Bacillus sp. AFS023182]
MPSIQDTIYPRIKHNLSEQDLDVFAHPPKRGINTKYSISVVDEFEIQP